MEYTFIIIKPDAVHRALAGEIVKRFEQKGLKIIGMKMQQLSDSLLDEHYAHHKGKPFFAKLKEYMRSIPVILVVLEGRNAVDVVREMCGVTDGSKAAAGTIRGDFSVSVQYNLVHASDSKETAEKEIKRFFKKEELFSYTRIDLEMLYAGDERK
ncbi:nucleoside-diphosphate kinase [Candidatus Woesearchaeota archaeon]|nr:nucleoside-diphosphate kinase [Candidatus Woesearchaeota archaeon]